MTLESSNQSWPPIVHVLKGHRAAINVLVNSTDHEFLLSASDDNTILVWGRFLWDIEAILEGHSDRITLLEFSPDGRKLASASGVFESQDRTVLVWDTETWQLIHTLKSDTWINSVCFSPDSGSLKAASGKYI